MENLSSRSESIHKQSTRIDGYNIVTCMVMTSVPKHIVLPSNNFISHLFATTSSPARSRCRCLSHSLICAAHPKQQYKWFYLILLNDVSDRAAASTNPPSSNCAYTYSFDCVLIVLSILYVYSLDSSIPTFYLDYNQLLKCFDILCNYEWHIGV